MKKLKILAILLMFSIEIDGFSKSIQFEFS